MEDNMGTIVIDTREQKPYSFNGSSVVKKLDTGDYSLEGYEDLVTVERKSLIDFLGCLFPHKNSKTGGWIRFEKELTRMVGFRYSCIVIEASWKHIVNGTYGRSQAHPNSVMGKIMKITVNFGIPIYFVGTHALGSEFVGRYLKRVEEAIKLTE